MGQQLLALGPLGHWDLARRHATEALGEARDLSHPAAEAYALWLSMVLWQVVGELETVDAHAGRLTALAQELRAGYWVGIATAYRGWARAARGEAAAAIPTIRGGIATFRATGAMYLLPQYLTLLAAAHRAAGDDAAALEVIAEAAAEARSTGEAWSLPEILRIQGEVLASTRNPDLAGSEACLRGAVEWARAQGARGWELRATNSLARRWAEQGERQKAHHLLAPVYNWFTEGFDTADLKDAKALLDELA